MQDIYERDLISKLGLALVYTLLTLIALLGNSTILVIYFKWEATFKIYKVTYIFLLSLTLANLAVAIGVMPLSIASLVAGQWVFGGVMCTINGFVFTWMATVTILTVLLISFHRATVVLSPLRRIIKTGFARILSGAAWLIALIVPVPPLLGVSTYEYSSTRAFCRVRFVSEADTLGNVYSLVTVGLFVILPLLVVCIANIALYRVSVRLLQSDKSKEANKSKHSTGGRRMSRTIRGELKALTTVTMVMGIFVLCWAPQVILTIYGIISQQPTPDGLQTLQALCIFLNTALNPYIYIYANKETRKRFKEIVLCKWKQSEKPGRCAFQRVQGPRSALHSPTRAHLMTPRGESAHVPSDDNFAEEHTRQRVSITTLRNNFVSCNSTDRLMAGRSASLSRTSESEATGA